MRLFSPPPPDDATTALARTEKEIIRLTAMLNIHRRHNHMAAALEKSIHEEAAARALLNSIKKKREQAERGEDLFCFAPDLAHLDHQITRTRAAEEEAKRASAALEETRRELDRLTDEITATKTETETMRRELAEEREKLAPVLKLETRIEMVSRKWREAVRRYEELEKAQARNLQSRTTLRRRIPRLETELSTLRHWLAHHDMDEALPSLESGRTAALRLREIQKEMAGIPDRLIRLKEETARWKKELTRQDRRLDKYRRKSHPWDIRSREVENRLAVLAKSGSRHSADAQYLESRIHIRRLSRLRRLSRQYRKQCTGDPDRSPGLVLDALAAGRDELSHVLTEARRQLAPLPPDSEAAGAQKSHVDELVRKQEQAEAEHTRLHRRISEAAPLCRRWDRLVSRYDAGSFAERVFRRIFRFRYPSGGNGSRHFSYSGLSMDKPDEIPALLNDSRIARAETRSRKMEIRELTKEARRLHLRRKKCALRRQEMERQMQDIQYKGMMAHERCEAMRRHQESLENEAETVRENLTKLLQKFGQSPPPPGKEVKAVERLWKKWKQLLSRQKDRERLEEEYGELCRLRKELPARLMKLKMEADGLAPRIRRLRHRLDGLKEKKQRRHGQGNAHSCLKERERYLKMRTAEQEERETTRNILRETLPEQKTDIRRLRNILRESRAEEQKAQSELAKRLRASRMIPPERSDSESIACLRQALAAAPQKSNFLKEEKDAEDNREKAETQIRKFREMISRINEELPPPRADMDTLYHALQEMKNQRDELRRRLSCS